MLVVSVVLVGFVLVVLALTFFAVAVRDLRKLDRELVRTAKEVETLREDLGFTVEVGQKPPGTRVARDHLARFEADSFYSGICPDCGEGPLVLGAGGGSMGNRYCAHCGSGFNDLVLAVERITDKSPMWSTKCPSTRQ